MSWKNLSIGRQIVIGFVVILCLLIAIGAVSYVGINSLKTNAATVIDGNRLDAVLAQFEVDHLNWANRINAFLSNAEADAKESEADDSVCRMGQWLNSPERKKYDSRIPELSPLFTALVAPHDDFHNSLVEIKKVFKNIEPELLGVLNEGESDHLRWASQIRQAFLQKSDSLGIESDSANCVLGKWMASEAARKAYAAGSPEFKSHWDGMLESHKKLHESAKTIEEKLTFKEASAAQQDRKNLMIDLEKSAEELSAMLDKLYKEVIRPSREKAETENDISELIIWSTAEAAVNETVIRSFLEMRRDLSLYETERTEELWQSYQSKVPVYKEGMGMALSALNSKEELIETTNKITQMSKDWLANAEMYKLKMEAGIKAETSAQEAQKIFNEQTMVLLDDMLLHLESLKIEVKAELEGVTEATRIYSTTTLPMLRNVQSLLGDIRSVSRRSVMTDEVMLESVKSTQKKVAMMSALAVLIGILFALFIPKGIVRILDVVSRQMDDAANQVASASQQVSASSQSLAGGTSQQAAAMQETASALDIMSAKTQQNAQNVREADTLMKEANAVVMRADQSMTALSTSILEISDASAETQKIVKTIDEIAFQTNLLALNAAVEAARAGEAGAGFAVVADEVRNLAIRAAEAAKNTSELIEGTSRRVQDGSEIVKKTNADFSKVSESVLKVGELLSEITLASNDQTGGIEQISRNISEIDGVTQQNAANAEESASASEEMSAQAHHMKALVNRLAAMVGGNPTLEKQGGKPMLHRPSLEIDHHKEVGRPKQIVSTGRPGKQGPRAKRSALPNHNG
ncbi:MAG: CZB domain-containing protein [Proteobacteria bacterium]|nr:CZB domain-containing protein [Pseudomonadota bacterium]MBU4469293.1 CZB domain-containing protein [Pseudomonadota bacterium]MCG2750772.1 methyl-accepting chemotaxis protein [Desulfobacteraceae bacterium]